MLRLAFVTGTEPGKWFERFRKRTSHGGLRAIDTDDPMALLAEGTVDLALTRLPDARISSEHHVVSLYEEAKGVAVPKDSVFGELRERLTGTDIADEHLNYQIAEDGSIDLDELRTALQVVAANVGIVIAPKPVLKMLARNKVEALELADASVPATSIALVWNRGNDSAMVQDFVGVAKGRTRNSSRQVAPKRSAREKTLAKQARRNKRR